MRFTIFKSRAFSASVQSIGFIVGGIALTFHFASSSAQEAGIEAESKAAITVDNNMIANAIKDRQKNTGRQLFEHTWEWSINPPAVNKTSPRERRLCRLSRVGYASCDWSFQRFVAARHG